MSQKRVLTGVKPTGTVHLGNYVGAIKPAVKLINDARDCFLFVADYHALNAVRDAKELKESSYSVAATYLAFGIDLDKRVFIASLIYRKFLNLRQFWRL